MAKRAGGNGDATTGDGVLDARRARAVDLLLAGRTIPDVAAELRVNRRTVWRWTTEPAFAAELARGRDARRCALREQLDAAAGRAVARLLAVLDDPATRPADVVRAACAVLDRAGLAPGPPPEAAGVEGWAAREGSRAASAELGALVASLVGRSS